MKQINMDRRKLLEVVEANRAKHEAEYKEALDEFHRAKIKECEENLTLARNHETVSPWSRLAEPMNNLEDYDRVIKMLEYSEDKIVPITADEFEKYVQDNWEWKHSFNDTKLANAAYLGRR